MGKTKHMQNSTKDSSKNSKDKLIRDKIPEIAKDSGRNMDYYVANSDEYWVFLKKKLIEECQEFLESEETEEVADILEVIDAILYHKDINLEDLHKIKRAKLEKRGGFKNRFIMKGSA